MWARDYFEMVRDCVVRHRRLELERQFGRPKPGVAVATSGVSDSTWVSASAGLESGEEMARLEREIGDGLALCAGLRKAFTRKADAVELHYIGVGGDPLGYRDVARELGVSRTTAARWVDEMMDWCDLVGPVRARSGMGVAEG